MIKCPTFSREFKAYGHLRLHKCKKDNQNTNPQLNLTSGSSNCDGKQSTSTPTRSTVELLARFLKPERRWTDAQLKSRALGLAYANCGVNPNLHQIAKDAFDKFPNVPIDIIGSGYLSYLRAQHIHVPEGFPDRNTLLAKLEGYDIINYISDWPEEFSFYY